MKKSANSILFTYWFNDFVNQGSLKTKGAAIKNIVSVKELKKYQQPLPSLEKQKRIAAKIDSLFAKIDKAIALTEESLRQAENLLPAVLKQTFDNLEGRSVVLPEIVKENKYSIKRGPFGSSLKKQFFVESGYKVYEQKNAINNNFDLGHYFIDENGY